jgi:hypothetical protein
MIDRLVGRVAKIAGAVVFAISLALAPIQAEALVLPRYQTAWPALANSSSYTPACNRLTFPNSDITESSVVNFLGHIGCNSPNYAVTSLRTLFTNFYVVGDGTANPERCPGNSVRIDFATIFIAGVAYPVTFGGALSIVIDSCKFVWSDPLRDASGNIVTIAANTQYYVRTSKTIVSAGYQVVGAIAAVNPNVANNYAGITSDGFEAFTTAQTSLRTSGTVQGNNGNGNQSIGPALIVAKGWDGSKVYNLVGDSILYGENDWNFYSPYVSGAEMRALADSASGPRNFVCLCFPGTQPGDQSDIGAGHYQLRMQALRSIGNMPFDEVLSEMGQNSPTFSGSSLAAFEAVETDWWRFWHNNCPTCGIFQVSFPAHAGSFSNTKFTTLADQTTDYPAGARWRADAWIIANIGLPSYVTGIDLTTPFTTGSGFANQPGLWPITGWSGTISTAVSSGKVAVVAASVAPGLGDELVMNEGTSSVEVHNIVKITGSSSPWTLQLDGNIGHSYVVGAPVETALTAEGTHPYYPLYQAAANMLIGLKNSGALP